MLKGPDGRFTHAVSDQDAAVLGHMAELRLRLVQASAVAGMLELRPDLLCDLLPLLHEALDAPPLTPYTEEP